RFHFEGGKFVADFDDGCLSAGGLLQFADVTFHMLGGEEDKLALGDDFQVGRFWLEFVWIGAGFDVRSHLDPRAPDLLGKFSKDGGKRGDANGLSRRSEADQSNKSDESWQKQLHGNRSSERQTKCK